MKPKATRDRPDGIPDAFQDTHFLLGGKGPACLMVIISCRRLRLLLEEHLGEEAGEDLYDAIIDELVDY